jgi:hypothetical protein
LVAGCGSDEGGVYINSSHVAKPQNRHDVYERRCPGRGLNALPLGHDAEAAVRAVAAKRVGRSPQIDVAVRRIAKDAYVPHVCGPRIARRTLYVLTYDHRYDRGRNRSASLAQHRFYVSRFADGYHVWYREH